MYVVLCVCVVPRSKRKLRQLARIRRCELYRSNSESYRFNGFIIINHYWYIVSTEMVKQHSKIQFLLFRKIWMVFLLLQFRFRTRHLRQVRHYFIITKIAWWTWIFTKHKWHSICVSCCVDLQLHSKKMCSCYLELKDRLWWDADYALLLVHTCALIDLNELAGTTTD